MERSFPKPIFPIPRRKFIQKASISSRPWNDSPTIRPLERLSLDLDQRIYGTPTQHLDNLGSSRSRRLGVVGGCFLPIPWRQPHQVLRPKMLIRPSRWWQIPANGGCFVAVRESRVLLQVSCLKNADTPRGRQMLVISISSNRLWPSGMTMCSDIAVFLPGKKCIWMPVLFLFLRCREVPIARRLRVVDDNFVSHLFVPPWTKGATGSVYGIRSRGYRGKDEVRIFRYSDIPISPSRLQVARIMQWRRSL